MVNFEKYRSLQLIFKYLISIQPFSLPLPKASLKYLDVATNTVLYLFNWKEILVDFRNPGDAQADRVQEHSHPQAFWWWT